jgi:class 3 adenylate cyclase
LTRSGRRALQEGDALEASRTLTAALALWTGPALADLASEPYAAQEALRLEEMRLVAAEDRISADLALGRHAELVGELEGRVALHPLRERLWALLMLAAYRSGRQVEALRAYQSVRERLRDDLGLDPGPELQELNAAILRQDAALAAPSVPLPVPAAPEPTPGPAHSRARPESRRVASVVVAGLVGFDRTAGTLDPEDLRTLLDRCMTRLTQVVARYGGTVENVAAGELTAVLGAPIAHEDDPERAVRAAYDLQRAVAEHPDEFPGLGLCVGVSTGEVLLAAPNPLLRGSSASSATS